MYIHVHEGFGMMLVYRCMQHVFRVLFTDAIFYVLVTEILWHVSQTPDTR